MVSIAGIEIDLFGIPTPPFEDIKKMWPIVNSSETIRLEYIDKAAQHKDPLGAGLVLLLAGKFSDSIDQLNSAPDCIQKFMGIGYANRLIREYDKAIEAFDKAMEHKAEAITIAMEKAETYRQNKDFEKVQQQLDTCTNFQNVSAEYHYQLGKLLEANGDYEISLENYQAAIELDPDHLDALFSLAYSCDLHGDEESAMILYKDLIKKNPSHVNALLNLAVLYEDINEFDKACTCVEAVLFSHPNHAKANLFLKDIESSKNMIYDEEREKRKDRHNKILEIPISDFELSVRSRNCLKKMNIITIGDLLRTTEAELLSYKNFGETSLLEIKKILDSKNLRLGMALEEKGSEPVDPETVKGANKEILNKNVEELELSVRARRALGRLGVKSILELVNKTEAELLGCKNFGVTSLNEIKERLTQFGLSLRTLE